MPLLAGLSTLLFGLSESAVEVLTLCLSSWTFPLGLSTPERTPLAVRAVLPGVCVLHRLLLAALDLFAVFDGSSGLRGLAGGSESKFGALDNFSARGFVRFTKLRESGFGGAAVRVFLADWDLFLVLLGSIGGFEVLFVWTIRHLAEQNRGWPGSAPWQGPSLLPRHRKHGDGRKHVFCEVWMMEV